MVLKNIHVVLAYLTVIGFVVRGIWSIVDSGLVREKWVKVLPHIIDTLLLTIGIAMALRLGLSPMQGWLGAKLLTLLSYIGFGVLTMRASNKAIKIMAFGCALMSVGYLFSVAFSRNSFPFG